jgi:23S rRNA G2445 N2-methylase RlmL
MRERAERLDPQQRRRPLPPGHHHYYATCHPGLEAVVAAELAAPAIGAADVHPGERRRRRGAVVLRERSQLLAPALPQAL